MLSNKWRSAAIAVAACAALQLSGCASNPYRAPSGAGVATLQEFHTRDGLLTWSHYRVAGVDGQVIPPPILTTPGHGSVKLAPGQHRILIHAEHNNGWGDGPYEAFLPLGVTVESGATYQLHGEIREEKVRVWMERDHSVVSLVSEAGYRSAPPQPVVIPVMVPRR